MASVQNMNLPQLLTYARENDIAIGDAYSRDEVAAIIEAAESGLSTDDTLVTVDYEGITVNISKAVMQDYSFIRALAHAQKNAGENTADALVSTVEMMDTVLGDEWASVEAQAREKFGYVSMDFMVGLFRAIMEEMRAKNS